MSYDLIKPNSSLGSVWIISTVGNKASYRKIYQKTISRTPIPNLCTEILSSALNLKVSSQLMLGLALVYKYKVDHLMNDVSSLSIKLKQDLALKRFMAHEKQLSSEPITMTTVAAKNRQICLLHDDTSFDIRLDMVEEFEDNDETEFHRETEQQKDSTTLIFDISQDLLSDTEKLDFEFAMDGSEKFLDMGILNNEAETLSKNDSNNIPITSILPEISQINELVSMTNELSNSRSDFVSFQGDTRNHNENNSNIHILNNRKSSHLNNIDSINLVRKRVLIDENPELSVESIKSFKFPHLKFKRHKPFFFKDLVLESINNLPNFFKFSQLQALNQLNLVHIPQRKNFQSFIQLDQEVEASRRALPTSNIFLHDDDESSLDMDYSNDNGVTFDFSIDNIQTPLNFHLSEEEEEDKEEEQQQQEVHDDVVNSNSNRKPQELSHSLFLQYIRARAIAYGYFNQSNEIQIPFSSITPFSGVTKKIAAASFHSMLFLATTSKIGLKYVSSSTDIVQEILICTSLN